MASESRDPIRSGTSPPASRLLSAIATVGVLSVAAKSVLVAKDVLVASAFGTANVLDSFLLATLVPFFVSGILASSITSAFLPQFISVREERGSEAAQALARSVLLVSALGSLGLTVVFIFAGRAIVGFLCRNRNHAEWLLTTQFYAVLIWSIPLVACGTVFSAVLNARNRFVTTSLTPAVTPLLMSVLLLLAAPRLGLWTMVIGSFVGAGIETAILATAARHEGIKFGPLRPLAPELRTVLVSLAPMAGAALIMSGSVIVDQVMVSRLPRGGVSTLSYGGKLVSFVLAIVSVALTTPLLPRMSQFVAHRDFVGLREAIGTYLRWIFLVSAPITIVAYFGSPFVVELLLHHGAFTTTDAASVTVVQQAYIMQVPFFVASTVLVRAISALNARRVIVFVGSLNFMTNAVFDVIFIRYWGATGIALSTSVMYVIACICLYASVMWVLRGLIRQAHMAS